LPDVRRQWVEPNDDSISMRRQCELLGLNRSTLYYETQEEGRENLRLMRLLDEQYTCTPFYGIRRMTAWLR
jgi:putative transposase